MSNKNKNYLKNELGLWDNIKQTNIEIMGDPDGKRERKEIGKTSEKNNGQRIHKLEEQSQRNTKSLINTNKPEHKKTHPACILIKLSENKDKGKGRLLKAGNMIYHI